MATTVAHVPEDKYAADALVPPITKREREIAIRVVMQSKMVMNWVRAEAAFFNIKPGTPEWSKFFREHARKAAMRAIQ